MKRQPPTTPKATDMTYLLLHEVKALAHYTQNCKNLWENRCPYIKLLEKIVAIVKKNCSVYVRLLYFLRPKF